MHVEAGDSITGMELEFKVSEDIQQLINSDSFRLKFKVKNMPERTM